MAQFSRHIQRLDEWILIGPDYVGPQSLRTDKAIQAKVSTDDLQFVTPAYRADGGQLKDGDSWRCSIRPAENHSGSSDLITVPVGVTVSFVPSAGQKIEGRTVTKLVPNALRCEFTGVWDFAAASWYITEEVETTSITAADAVDSDRGTSIVHQSMIGEPIAHNLSDNDTLSSSGVTTFALVPGSEVNLSNVVIDAATGAYTADPVGLGAYSFNYSILVDGVVQDTAIEQGVRISGDAVNNIRAPEAGTVGDEFTYNLSDGDTLPTSGTVTYALNGNDINVAAVTGFNALTGSCTVRPIAYGAWQVGYNLLVDGVVVDSAVNTGTLTQALTQHCGTLPERMAIPSILSASNPFTAANGSTRNLSAVFQFRTAGGTLIATVTQTGTVVSGNFLADMQSENPGTINANLLYNDAGSVFAGFAINNPASNGGPTSGIVDIIQLDWSVAANISATGLDVSTCAGSSARSNLRYWDVDQGSKMSDLSRPWDNIYALGSPSTSLPPTESPAGTFTFGTQMNAVPEWNADLQSADSMSVRYHLNAGDVLKAQAVVWYTPAVKYSRDGNGDIVSAETVDGPLDPAEWPNIV